MENLCETCKTNCMDKLQYSKENIRIRECAFYTEKEHAFQHGKCSKCSQPRLTCAVVGNKAVDHDTCLGHLPGVISACCGHGRHEGHVLFRNGTMIRFKDTVVKKNYIPEDVAEKAIAAMEG